MRQNNFLPKNINTEYVVAFLKHVQCITFSISKLFKLLSSCVYIHVKIPVSLFITVAYYNKCNCKNKYMYIVKR